MVNCGQIGETMTGSVGLGTLLRAFFPHASLPVVRPHTEDGKAEGLWEVEETHQKRLGGDSRCHHRAHGRRWPNDSVAGEKS